MAKMCSSSKFDYVILLFIFCSSILLALETPFMDPNSGKAEVIKILDIIMTVVFTLEFIIKVIAYGFVLNGSNSYLRNFWNLIDFVILIPSVRQKK